MALKNFKRVFDGDKPYLVLTPESGSEKYDTVIIIDADKTVFTKTKLEKSGSQDIRTSLKVSDEDLVYDLADIEDCKDRKKGFKFKDSDAGKEMYVNASNTIIYGNAEVLGVDINALYISADKRLIGKGNVDSSRIKNQSIQSALEFANIDGLKGELGCDVNGVEHRSLYYLNVVNKVAKKDVADAKKAWEDAVTKADAAESSEKTSTEAARDKALKKYLNTARAYLRMAEEEKNNAEIEEAKKSVADAQEEIIKSNIQNEDSFLESLGIRFKKASLIHYEAQDVSNNFNEMLIELHAKLDENTQLLLVEKK